MYNKPRSSSSDTPTEHAGFLMGLGLNGHLSRLTTLSIHDYLAKVSAVNVILLYFNVLYMLVLLNIYLFCKFIFLGT